MKVWSSFARIKEELPVDGLVVTVGNFDGMHMGHQVLLNRNSEVARAHGWFSMVVTFREHTSVLIRHAWPPMLMSLEERLQAFSSLGMDGCLLLDFTPELAKMDPERFLSNFLNLGVKAFIVGHDFKFGKGAVGNTEYLLDFARRYGLIGEVIPPVRVNGEIVCSTRIRRLLKEGLLQQANAMLNRAFRLTGTVVHGDHRGRTLGYPTANLSLSPNRLLPKYGVYLVRCWIRNQEDYGLASVGVKPTFSATGPVVEVYLFDTCRDLYGETLSVDFLEFIREERKFSSAEELVAQMKRDEERGRRLIALQQQSV